MTLAPSLFPDRIETAAPPGRGLHGYYRRGANGWIVVAATTPANRSHYEYKGFTQLPQYGEFRNGTTGGSAREADVNGVAWNPADEPWRLILQKGGAKEFPLAQVIAFRWHVRPPYRDVVFPQLEGAEITNYQCPECDRGLFSDLNPQKAAQDLKTHLTSKIDNAHAYAPADLRELGKEWGINFDSARMGKSPVRTEPCGCGYAPPADSKNAGASLRMHRRHCEKAPVEA